jgi:chemotaxis protein CheC
MLLYQPVGTTLELGEMEISALAEAGNVAGSFFLTTMAERAGLTLPPTPPVVIHEMCGAILDTVAAELAVLEHDEAIVIEAQFACDGQVVEVSFFMFPGEVMTAALATAQPAGHAW